MKSLVTAYVQQNKIQCSCEDGSLSLADIHKTQIGPFFPPESKLDSRRTPLEVKTALPLSS